MNESWNSFRLRKAEHRETGISSHTNNSIRFKSIHDSSHLEKTFKKLERETNIFYQRTPVKPRNVDPCYLIPSLWHFFHFHLPFCTYKENFYCRIDFLNCIGYCNSR